MSTVNSGTTAINFVATAAFPTSSQPPMIMTFGSSYGYTPTTTQTALMGTAQYSTPNPSSGTTVSSGIVMYAFTIATTVSSPFSFGEMLLTSPNGSTVYAIGTLPSLLSRVAGESVEVTVFFNTSTNPVTAFGYESSSVGTTLVPYIGPISSLAPVNLNPAAGNMYLVQSPVNVADSMLAYASYKQTTISNDFDSWSFENYVLVGESLSTGTASGGAVIPTSVPSQTFTGQYIFQTADYVRAVSGVTSSSGTSNVPLDSAALAQTPANTAYKIYQYVGTSSAASAFLAQITVTPAQINAIAALTPSLVLLSNGTVPMTGPLNLAGFKVIATADATNATDAVNLETMTSSFGLSQTELSALSNAVAANTAIMESLQASVAAIKLYLHL